MAGKAAPLWTVSCSTLMRWNTFFTGYLKHFCSALRGSKNGLEFKPHIFPGMCPFLSREGWGFEALWMWDSQSRCRMSSINNINTIFSPMPTHPSKRRGFHLLNRPTQVVSFQCEFHGNISPFHWNTETVHDSSMGSCVFWASLLQRTRNGAEETALFKKARRNRLAEKTVQIAKVVAASLE